ncbi:MAG: nucleotidyltransferase family protein [Acidobacteria bacterium]|nr:nucleotidyltransferase family protein [Acidobacteriota bacterium]
MGQDKALLTFHGRTFLETIIAKLYEAGIERMAVVLGHHAEEIQHTLKLEGVEVVVNRNYGRGQTSSLQEGLRALEGSNPEAVVLCLVDHPAFSPATVRGLIEAFERSRSPAAIPTFQGRRGHPVLIGRALFFELLSLSPDEGADTVIRKYRDATQFVQVKDEAVLIDVDDPETYRQLGEQ